MPIENLSNIIRWLYPSADYEVRQDKETDGPYISKWNLAGVPKPTETEIMNREAEWLASRRRPRQENDIALDLYNWINAGNTQAEKNDRVMKLLCRVAGYLMRIDPQLAQRQGATISGEEPIP